DAFIKSDVCTAQCVQRHGSKHIRRGRQVFCGQQSKTADGQHGLCAVDERDGPFGLGYKRFDLSAPHGLGAVHARAFVRDLAFTDHGQSEMSQWGQIAACAYAALGRNYRMDFAADHLTKQVDDIRPYAGEAFGQRVGAQHHHRACLSLAERFTYAGRMRTNQVELELAVLSRFNVHITEFAYARGDGVRYAVFADELVYHRPSRVNFLARIRRQHDRPVVIHDFTEVVERQVISIQLERIHELCVWRVRAKAFMYFSGSERR